MFFDDLFYPGNPKRRQEVANLRAEIAFAFKQYGDSWNEVASLLNGIFARQPKGSAYGGMQLLLVKKSVEKDALTDCLQEIGNVIADAQGKLNKLVVDIGLAAILPEGWERGACTISEIGADKILAIGKALSSAGDAAVSAFIGFYVFNGAAAMGAVGSAVAGVAVGIGASCASLLLGAVVCAAGFVVADLVSSAITGAIERKKLNEAIEVLRALKAQVAPLPEAARRLSEIKQSIDDGRYKLDDTHVLLKKPDGSYIIIDMAAIALKGNWLLTAQSREEAEGILFLSA